MTDSKKIPIHVTSMGQRYVEVEDLIRNESVQDTLKKMTALSKKHAQKSVDSKQKGK